VTSIGILLFLALTTNLPLGWWRARQRRFSLNWFVGIHASIPFLIATRFALGLSLWVIPVEIVFAVAGQIIGARVGP